MKTFEISVETQIKGSYLISSTSEETAIEELFETLHRQYSTSGIWDFDIKVLAVIDAN